jgi:choline dehydrogenase-like flavoprotein
MTGREVFDYVIVGAGVAGCVLAYRLTADPSVRVLLLEAGPWGDDHRITTPSAWPDLIGSEYDWRYRTEPQPHLNNRVLDWPRGRLVGGSGAMNAMVYVRGHRFDFDSWAAWGGTEWDADHLLPEFDRIEDPHNGVLCVSEQLKPHPLSAAFIEAAHARGIPFNPDFNLGTQHGVGYYRLTCRDQRRHHTAEAYLRPASDRPNLVVRDGAHVTRLKLRHGRVTGVEYRRAGTAATAWVDREVVLCAGTIGSPQLLLLSGIGPADALREQAIAVQADLAGVGRNLHDHIQLSVSYPTADSYPISATSNLGEAGGFVSSRPGLPADDIQLSFAPMLSLNRGEGRGRGFTIGPAVTRPLSRGYLTLRSANAEQPPRIQPNYLEEPADLNVLVEGVRIVEELAATPPLAGYRSDGPTFPRVAGTSRRDVERFVRAGAETQFHPVGTCRFGTDELAVVDPRLRVRGVDGLRVADASVVPAVPTGNTQAPVIVVAERAARLIGDP